MLDGIVYRADVEAKFREEGVRFCDPAEALAPRKKPPSGAGRRTVCSFHQGLKGQLLHQWGPDAWSQTIRR